MGSMSVRHHQSTLRLCLLFVSIMSAIAASQRASSASSLFFRNMFSGERVLPMAFGGLNLTNKNYGPSSKRCSRPRNFFRYSTSASENEVVGSQPGEEQTKVRKRKKKNNSNSKDKRREFIGKAKAVDRGQWAAVYNPGGDDRVSFTAKSGLPNRTKPFTVLGIESSCDDTGGAFFDFLNDTNFSSLS
jgi:hypothetical protein